MYILIKLETNDIKHRAEDMILRMKPIYNKKAENKEDSWRGVRVRDSPARKRRLNYKDEAIVL